MYEELIFKIHKGNGENSRFIQNNGIMSNLNRTDCDNNIFNLIIENIFPQECKEYK